MTKLEEVAAAITLYDVDLRIEAYVAGRHYWKITHLPSGLVVGGDGRTISKDILLNELRVRLVLKAIREPSNAMVAAAEKEFPFGDAYYIWPLIIDHLLSESPG